MLAIKRAEKEYESERTALELMQQGDYVGTGGREPKGHPDEDPTHGYRAHEDPLYLALTGTA